MKIQFVTFDNIDTIKTNLGHWEKNFQKDSSDWLKENLSTPLFVDAKFQEIPDFVLDMSAEPKEAYTTEGANSIKVYSHLKFLSDSQASDERLWAGLCLGPFWSYVKYRWGIDRNCTATAVKDHFFFGQKSWRRSLTRNAISRLWWIGRLTYDCSNANDPWELTRFICRSQDYILHGLERNFSNNPKVIRPFLKAIINAQGNGIAVNTNVFADLAKYLNMLGGTYILDCLPEDRIYQKIYAKAEEISTRGS